MRSYTDAIPALGRLSRLSSLAEHLPWSASDNHAKRIVRDLDDAEFGRGLGWASIGIGLTELLAPQKVEEMLGLADRPERRGVIRVLGVREVCHGIGILTESEANERMKVGLWSRVAGDVLDSALLGIAAAKTSKPFMFGVVTAMVLGIGLADLLCAKRLSQDA